jgi:transposase-like protein
MHTTLIKAPTRRGRRRYTEEFKRQAIEACMQPGVSMASVALANGLNANLLRRWVIEHQERTPKGGLEPYAWLKDVLEKLPVWPYSRIDELLPLRPTEIN